MNLERTLVYKCAKGGESTSQKNKWEGQLLAEEPRDGLAGNGWNMAFAVTCGSEVGEVVFSVHQEQRQPPKL